MSKLTTEEVQFLARILVSEWYGATTDDKERKEINRILVKLDWEGGLSEDTYFEMTSPRCKFCGKIDAWLVVIPEDTDDRINYCDKNCYMLDEE